ncbi:MAG: MATE family efflux transporter [Arenicella sp.]|nr:MATE family efflux transporter [Arenicella sp.]
MPVYSELKSLVKLAAPVSLAQLSLVGMSATDVLIAGRASTLDLAGMNLGVNVWNMTILFFMGIGFATQPLVAKHFGAKDEAAVKHQLHQSIWMCLALGLVAMLVVWSVAWGFQFIDFEAQMLLIARDFLFAISLCAIPMSLMPAVRGTLEGMSLTRVVFLVNFAAFLINIPLDYVLVNGLYGLPKLGGVGCAWATVVLMWAAFLINILVLRSHAKLKHSALLSDFEKPNSQTIRNTFRLGLPIGVSIVIELAMFSGAGIMIAKFGVIEAGAHAVAIVVASLSFMLYTGLGQGVTIRASQLLGSGLPDQAWFAVKVGTLFNLAVSVVICIAYLIFTEPLIRLFTSDPEVIRVAVVLLYFGAAFQIADCLQVAMVCALRAYHDTSSPPKYQLLAFWGFGLPIGVGLSFYGWWPGLEGARGMWFAMVVSLSIVGLLLLRRLAQHMREFNAQGENQITL